MQEIRDCKVFSGDSVIRQRQMAKSEVSTETVSGVKELRFLCEVQIEDES